MNCQELRTDIEKLTGLRNDLAAKLDILNGTGKGVLEIRDIKSEVPSTQDEILGKYLNDFAERNPEFFEIKVGKKIAGSIDEMGRDCGIRAVFPLPGNGALVGGDFGALHVCKRNKDGGWELSEKIDGIYRDGLTGEFATIKSILALPDGNLIIDRAGTFYSCKTTSGKWELQKEHHSYDLRTDFSTANIIALPDGGLLVGGEYGSLHCFYKDEDKDGEWIPEEKIIGEFTDAEGYGGATIHAMAVMADGSILIGGANGALQCCQKNTDGIWEIGENIDGFGDWGVSADIRVIAALPDGRALVGGVGGALYCCQKDEFTDEWELGKNINDFITSDFNSIAVLPDGSVLIGDEHGGLNYLQETADGNWKLKSIQTELDDHGIPIDSIVTLADGNVLIASSDGSLYPAEGTRSVDNLKKHLDDIISKSTN